MKSVFADSYYFIALLNPRDGAHKRALNFTNGFVGEYVTTGAVLTELADALARPSSRLAAGRFIAALPSNKAVHIVAIDEGWFQIGLTLYLARADKEWSLTDCISFAVMQKKNITEALTGDKHFEQAGFTALLK